MRLSGYLCIAATLAGLLVWVASLLFEPRVYFLTGTASSLSVKEPLAPLFPLDIKQQFRGLPAPAEEVKPDARLINESITLLIKGYGSLINTSRVMPAVLEEPGKRRVGVAVIMMRDGEQHLVVVTSDGWMGEYKIPGRD